LSTNIYLQLLYGARLKANSNDENSAWNEIKEEGKNVSGNRKQKRKEKGQKNMEINN
jgi:hypothetical protein